MNVAALLQDSPSEDRNSKRNNNLQSPPSSRAHLQTTTTTTPTSSLHASPAMASLRPVQDRPPTSSTANGAGSPSASSVTAWAPASSSSSSIHNINRAQDRIIAPATTQTLVGPGTQGGGEFFCFCFCFFLFIFIKIPTIFSRRQIIPFYSYSYATFDYG